MGTALNCPPQTLEEILSHHPEKILALHREYIDAGAEMIFTATFGAGKWKKRKTLIDQAISLARRAAGSRHFVAASLGPFADAKQSAEEIQKNYEEVVGYFREKPIDLLVLETQYHAKEIGSALEAIRLIGPMGPIGLIMTVNQSGKLHSGECCWEMLPFIEKSGVTLTGLNCSFGPADLFPVFLEMKKRTSLPLLIKPNAGLPGGVIPDHEFAEWIKRFVDAGAAIVGGCCQTTPQTIQSLQHLLKQPTP